MEIVFNGETKDVHASTVQALVEELGLATQRVALERNRELLPRRLWPETRLQPGDRIELVQFVGGG